MACRGNIAWRTIFFKRNKLWYVTTKRQTLWEKKCVLQLALQFKLWVEEDNCNSLYLYTMNANGQVA